MADISKITLPSGNTYNIKDTVARNMAAVNVYDGLDSTSSSDALSAKQGKVLNDAINTNLNKILYNDFGTLQMDETKTFSFPAGYTYSNCAVVYSYFLLSNGQKYPGVLSVDLLSSSGIQMTNNGGAPGHAVVGLVKTSQDNNILHNDFGTLQMGETKTFSFPAGYTYSNCAVVYSYLLLSNGQKYPGVLSVDLLSSSGIQMTNNGGAPGHAVVGLVKTS